MPLSEAQSLWLFRFSGGAIPLAGGVELPGDGDPRLRELKARLEALQAREFAEEQALKAVLLAKAFKVIDEHRDEMRDNFDLEVETRDEDPRSGSAKKTISQQDVRDKDGRQERAYDAMESQRLVSVKRKKLRPKGDDGVERGPAAAVSAMQAMSILVGEKDRLASERVSRSHLDAKGAGIVQRSEPLFSDAELMNELYTPLVRDLVVPETFVPDKYSATQQMIDGSDDYYIKECKSKGNPMPTGAAALAKGAINLGASVATTVLGTMAPVKAGQEAMGTSDRLTKEWAARATDITNGVAATLCGVVDAADQIDDLRTRGDFSVAGYQTVLNGLAVGLGKMVAGGTGNMTLGLVITDSITGAVSLTSIAGEVAMWKKKGGEFPVESLFTMAGGCIAAGLASASDQTSDSNKDGSDNGLMSTRFAQASQAATQAFNIAGKAAGAKLGKEIKAGHWGAVFDFMKATAVEVSKQLPAQIALDRTFNTKEDYADLQIVGKSIGDTTDALDKGGRAALDLFGMGAKAVGGRSGASAPSTPEQQRMAEIDKRFEEMEKKLAAEAEAAAGDEVADLEKQMAEEKEAFRKSLLCLGSKEPSDAEFKSIARLVEQLERDRAIWDGLTALFGGGIGAAGGMAAAMAVASEVVPALKAAGQLVKYCVNLKAAADRCEAWLSWREGRKDAESAVSPYATSVDNFCRNQGTQFTHYSIQAAANAIQALLACGEMSPLAPAFKAAGGAVAASAAAEDLIYQFYKRQALAKAWQTTRQALDPKNKGNRKMALLARQVNPTLAKYTVAYGALVEGSPVAITMCNRIGIDRETLARSGDKVSELKNYLEQLYPDDGTVVGVLDVTVAGIAIPAVSLSTRAWALSYLAWSEKQGLHTPNPPAIVAHLSIVERLSARDDRDDADDGQLGASLVKLQALFLSFEPQTDAGTAIDPIRQVVITYAELAEARWRALDLEQGSKADAVH